MTRITQSEFTATFGLDSSEQSSIVVFGSIAATMGIPFHTSVAASKGAIEGFAKALAAEYAPKIRVNVVAPSLTNTPLANKFINSESKQEKSAARHPSKRLGKPEDIANMATFLLSEKSSWITGQIFHVDGGMSTLLVNGSKWYCAINSPITRTVIVIPNR